MIRFFCRFPDSIREEKKVTVNSNERERVL